MFLRILINLFLILFISVIQISFVSSLPEFFNTLNLVLLVIVFILVFGGYSLAFWWTIGFCVFFEIYFFLPFGIYSLNLLLSFWVAYFLLQNFFTNRSLYSVLALVFFVTLSYNLFLIISIYLASLFSKIEFDFVLDWHFLKLKAGQLFLNVILAIIAFYFINFISYKWSPVFLKRR